MLYVTTALLRPDHAQTIQIGAMAEAFAERLGQQFLLISPAVPAAESLNCLWRQIPYTVRARPARYIELALRTLWEFPSVHGEFVFTRDIGLAWLFHARGAQVTYEIHKPFATRIGDTIFRALANQIRYIAISHALKHYMVSQYRLEDAKVLVAHDGVALEQYERHRSVPKSELRRRLGLPIDAFLLVHTGSLYDGRGMEFFQPILRECPEVFCISVGGQPFDVQRWQHRYQAFPRMLFVDHQRRDIVVQYQLAADLLFFPMTRQNPIWWCSSPLKLFEYMATGIPILGSRIGSAGEILTDELAVLFDPDDSAQIVKALRWSLQNRNETQRRAEYARQIVAAQFTWRARAAGIIDFMGMSSGKVAPDFSPTASARNRGNGDRVHG